MVLVAVVVVVVVAAAAMVLVAVVVVVVSVSAREVFLNEWGGGLPHASSAFAGARSRAFGCGRSAKSRPGRRIPHSGVFGPGMPRSQSPLTEHHEDDSFGSSDASAHDDSDSANITGEDEARDEPDRLQALERRQAAAEHQRLAQVRKARAQRWAILERVVCAALREICLFYMAKKVHLETADRRTSGAKLGAQRRRVQDLEPGDAYAIVQAQLEEPMAKELDQAYTTFAGLYNQRLSENDEAWLEQLGASGAPPRHLVIQHMARLARPFLQMQLERSLANFLAPWTADQTQDHLYLPSVRIMLPLLGDDGRRQFQLWYTSYMAGSTVQPPPLHEDHDDETMEPPEPASGSAGP